MIQIAQPRQSLPERDDPLLRQIEWLRQRAGRLAVLWLVLGPTLMLLPLWFAPTSAGEDDAVYYYPLRVMTGQAIRAGHWNAWNPYEQCGMPLLADPQAAVLYPPTWLFAATSPDLAYSLNIFIAFALAGLGAFVYLRKIGLSVLPSVMGATAFQYCGFMIGHRVHLSVISTSAMLGFGLWAIESLRDRPRRALLVLPWVLFIALAAGHWPTFLNLMLLWGAYLLIRCRPIGRYALLAGASLLVAVLLMAPQLSDTYGLLQQTTRQRIGYATFGENSFLPTNAILAFFPLLMGCRTQNFFVNQPWWGAWHLCETLPYVGLLTLMFASSAIVRLRKAELGGRLAPLVRLWMWLALGAFIWMLGYYMPTYWLIHKIPVLNIVRAPARMVLGVDFALATLAAIAVHSYLNGERSLKQKLARTFRRWSLIYIPCAMLVMLAMLSAGNAVLQRYFPIKFPDPFAGGALQVWAALRPQNPALWMPVVMLGIAAIAIHHFIEHAREVAPLLLAVLVLDLLVVAHSVDIPGDLSAVPDPAESQAAEYLKEHAGEQPYRVLHLTSAYFAQPSETLAPKACSLFGVENLAGYGPFQYREHARLFGLRIFGYSREWEQLVRRNYLLSLYNVRYLVAEKPFCDAIESVVVQADAPAEGENLLTPIWRSLHRATRTGGVLSLKTPFMWDAAIAVQGVAGIQPGKVYRIDLDVRSPEGAANFLQADISGNWDEQTMVVYPEQISPDWRHFEWTFRVPEGFKAKTGFRLLTLSETAIQVRDVTLREASVERPINLGGKLRPGESVYERVAQFESDRPGCPAISVYENKLCLPRSLPVKLRNVGSEENVIEELRWHPEKYDLTQEALASGKNLPEKGVFVSETPGQVRAAGDEGKLLLRGNGLGTVQCDSKSLSQNKINLKTWYVSLSGLLLYLVISAFQALRLTRPI